MSLNNQDGALPGFDAPPLCHPKHVDAKLSSPAGGYAFIHPRFSGSCGSSAKTGHLAGIWPPTRAPHVHEAKRQGILVTRLMLKLTKIYRVCS